MAKRDLLRLWKMAQIDERLLTTFSDIPREHFVPRELRSYAYEDRPLPTLRKQSISQPSTIMMMLQALDLQPGEKVFEIGAGVGYQAAMIASLIGTKGKLITTDVIPELVQTARQNLHDLGFSNALVLEADGSEGYPDEAPYDKIIITAACPAIPDPLIAQVREGGVIVAPVGDLEGQTMVKATKVEGKLELEFLGSFIFVPLKGRHGFKEVEVYYG